MSFFRFGNCVALASLAIVISFGACKPGALGPTKQYTQIDFTHGGTVSGVVHFTRPVPPPVEIDMAQDPVCAMGGNNMTSDYVVNNGGLGNVLVYIQSGLGDKAYPITRTPVTIDQRGCRFEPHVSAAMIGQAVQFLNSDNTRHNIHMDPKVAGNNAFDVSQGANSDPITRYFQAQELMIPIRCNNHPWMHSYLNVLSNPFFAVTDPSGHFSIKGLPPGTYTLTAVHETLGQKSATITVKADDSLHQQFTF